MGSDIGLSRENAGMGSDMGLSRENAGVSTWFRKPKTRRAGWLRHAGYDTCPGDREWHRRGFGMGNAGIYAGIRVHY